MPDLYDNIVSLCKQRGVSITRMCTEAHASRGAVRNLACRKTQSLNIRTAWKIARYFDVSLSDLYEQQKNPATVRDGMPSMSESQKEIIQLVSRLTEDEASLLLSRLKAALQGQ